MAFSRLPVTSNKHQRRRLSPAPRSSTPPFCFLRKPATYAAVAATITLLLAFALTADLVLLQAYESVLSEHHGKPNFLLEPPRRSLRQLEYATPTEYDKWPAKTEPEGRKLVWLMSFPNSGTSFTSRLVRDATKTHSASNYADETPSGEAGLRLPVFDDQPTGPFWIKPEASPEFTEPQEYVITKVRYRLSRAFEWGG
jgi:hypothetical protein